MTATPYWAFTGQEYSQNQIEDFIRQMAIHFIDEINYLEMLTKTASTKFDKNFSVDEIIKIIRN